MDKNYDVIIVGAGPVMKTQKSPFKYQLEVDEIIRGNGYIKYIKAGSMKDGKTFGAQYVILSPGRSGIEWLVNIAKKS